MKRTSAINILFMLPGIVIYGCMVVAPLILAFYYSFFNWSGFEGAPMKYIGLRNYIDGLHDFQFHATLYNTFFFTIVMAFFTNLLGLFFALLLNNRGKLTTLYRSIFFFPLLLSGVVVGFIWQTLLNYTGILNQILDKIGLEPVEFFSTPSTALWSISGIAIWGGIGFTIVIYLAGLQTISADYYDAATIDGATRWQVFNAITFPLLAPTLTMNIVFSLMGGLKQYDLVAVVTGGGPAGGTETMAFQMIREAFANSHFSYGSALGIYMLIIISAISVTTTIYLRRREENVVG